MAFDLVGTPGSQLLLCLAMLVLAGIAHGMFGFGFAMFATPLLALVLDYQTALVAAALPLFCMATLFLLLNYRLLLSEGLTRLILPGVVVGSLLGALLHASMPQYLALCMLALLLVFNALLPRILMRRQAHSTSSGKKGHAVLSACAGVTEAALNVGAPFILIYSASARLSRMQQLLALNLCFSVGKAIQIGVLTQTSFKLLSAPLVGLAIFAALGGQLLGSRLAGSFSEVTYKRSLAAFLYVMAFFLICRAVWME